MNEKLIEEGKLVLEEIYKIGFDIATKLKERNKAFQYSEGSKSLEEVSVDSNHFYFFMFDSYWQLFKIVSRNLENPLIQPWVRIVMEYTVDIFSYSQKSDEEKKKIATKYFLYNLGLLGGDYANLGYDKLLEFLGDSTEKSNFVELKKEGFPEYKILPKLHYVFDSPSKDKMPEFIEKHFLTFNGNPIKRKNLDVFLKEMSLYNHPSIVLNGLEIEFMTRSHIFKCFALISLFGMALIRFSYDGEIDRLNNKINKLITNLREDGLNDKER
jgi:hypothetical protein